ncbi:hypothetical protein E3P99_02668 [Wallemia hederae]|uniref:DNA damage-inducible protein 1 n=1 Tax=Wallemia hederae TaxID=1540922 RepID=A0A4V6TMC4_9BASI|nr:hypothetical protein E3P99_02668 [Wallemia hederae]
MKSLERILASSFICIVDKSLKKVSRKRGISAGDVHVPSKKVKLEPDLDSLHEAGGTEKKHKLKSPKSKKKKSSTTEEEKKLKKDKKEKKRRERKERKEREEHIEPSEEHTTKPSSTATYEPQKPDPIAVPRPSSPLIVVQPPRSKKRPRNHEVEPVLPEHRFTRWLGPIQIKELNDKYVKIQQGTFDEEERRIVWDWVCKYKERNGMDDEQLRERIFAPPKEKNRDTFWNDLTEHVPHRVLQSVYTHVRSRWHPHANKGIWTKDEEDRLQSAYHELGSRWCKIAEIVERPANECSDHYRRTLNCPNRRKGAWTAEEIEYLKNIVEPLLKERNYVTRDGHDPFWVTVQEKMNRERSAHQCRIKWEDEIRGRDLPNRRNVSDFRRSDCGILIRHILDMNIKERGVINFRQLSDDVYKGEWSVKVLRDKWRFIVYRSCGMDKEMARSLPFDKLMDRIKSTFAHWIEGVDCSEDEVVEATREEEEEEDSDEEQWTGEEERSGNAIILTQASDLHARSQCGYGIGQSARTAASRDIPASEQIITHVDKELSPDPTRKLKDEGITSDAMLGLRRKVQVAGREVAHDGEMMRLQLLGNRDILNQMKQVQPELADAAENNPQKFYELMQQAVSNKHVAEAQQADMLNSEWVMMSKYGAYRSNFSSPFDIESQKRIEEQIRQQAVAESFERAIEYNPETFGMVEMLYIDTQVNNRPVKAFVDSGAQSTIMSPKCAEACNLMRLLDTRFQGIAQGVGTAKILGRIHAAPMQIGDIFLQCSFTVTEGSGVDLLFGLDMLKRHQAIIDLRQHALIIQDRVIPFLAEHEIPKNKHQDPAQLASGSSGDVPQQPSIPPHSGDKFPGTGATLGSNAAPAPSTSTSTNTSSNASNNNISEDKISTLMELGVSREEAIQALKSTNGNVEYASSLLF